jgi:hypothetical protein
MLTTMLSLCVFNVAQGSPINCTILVQYGEPRSGSTFQFWLLQSISALKGFRYRVEKTHAAPDIANITSPCIFRSLKQRRDRREYAYTQLYPNFSAHPMAEVKNLGLLFGLNNDKLRQLHVHMKYWSILRRCCGSQSSIDHRNKMHRKATALLHPFETYDFVECNMYVMPQVEHYLTQTTVYQLLRKAKMKVVLEFHRPPWTPGYCKKADEKLRDGLDFNDKKIY